MHAGAQLIFFILHREFQDSQGYPEKPCFKQHLCMCVCVCVCDVFGLRIHHGNHISVHLAIKQTLWEVMTYEWFS